MKFLIQTVNTRVVHDSAFVLLRSIDHMNRGAHPADRVSFTLAEHVEYEKHLRHHIPAGSIPFVTDFIHTYFGRTVKPRNVPACLFDFAERTIENGTERHIQGRKFVKSNDTIKSFRAICETAPPGNYQISDVIEIESEWRGFVFDRQLVGLQNNGGDFTLFPDVERVMAMIAHFDDQPIAYALDVGVTRHIGTFIVEVNDFFACALFGFADHRYYIRMLSQWFYQFVESARTATRHPNL